MTSETKRQRTNATARLSVVLDKLDRSQSQKAVADVLAEVFGINHNDQARNFLLAYSAITTLIERSQIEVEKHLHAEWNEYGAAFPNLRVCFNPKASGNAWHTFKAHLRPTDVTAIRFTAARLRTIIPEIEALPAELNDVTKAIDDMEAALDAEGLSASSREVLRECLDEIRRAVREYPIWGAAELEKTLRLLTGALALNEKLRTELDENRASGGSIWEKIGKVGTRITVICTALISIHGVGEKYLPLIEKVLHVPAISAPAETKPPVIDGKVVKL